MFGLGMSEILMILVVVLVLFGPSKLPEMARTIGKGLREMRRASDDLRTAIMMEDLDRPASPVTSAAPPRLDAPAPGAVQDAEIQESESHDQPEVAHTVSRHETIPEEDASHGVEGKSDVDIQKLIADAERTAREQEEKQERELAASKQIEEHGSHNKG